MSSKNTLFVYQIIDLSSITQSLNTPFAFTEFKINYQGIDDNIYW